MAADDLRTNDIAYMSICVQLTEGAKGALQFNFPDSWPTLGTTNPAKQLRKT